MRKIAFGLIFLLFFISGTPKSAWSQTVRLDASNLVAKVALSFSPRAGSFAEGATFDVPILLDTEGSVVNGIEVHISFDKNKLEIVKPASGTSIIGVWVEPPSFDNTKGTANYVGVIPGGINTNSGLVGTMTFRAKALGSAVVSINSNSKILLNDGLGTAANVSLGRATYTVLAKAPEGVNIFSETHPNQDEWYNNNSPIISWDRDAGVSGFSYVLDDKPNTIPENTINTNETSQAYNNLGDGLWYFHIKAIKNGVWGNTGHFLIRIDTTPPAAFKPEINYLLASGALAERALVSFFTTDNLSGVDHYEVGVIDKNQPVTVSPAFVQADSPFQVPLSSNNLSVIVRAVDKAGNARDSSINVAPPSIATKFLKDNLVYILLVIILIGLLGFITHYLFGHHIVRHWRRAMALVKQEEIAEEIAHDKIEP